MPQSDKNRVLREALSPFPRWRLFGEGTATATFEFSEPAYAAGFVTRAIEQTIAFARIPDLSLSGHSVRLALALAVTRNGLSENDRRLLKALELAANHSGRPAPTEAPILSLAAFAHSRH